MKWGKVSLTSPHINKGHDIVSLFLYLKFSFTSIELQLLCPILKRFKAVSIFVGSYVWIINLKLLEGRKTIG